jgi:hypothetical protein
MDKAKSQKIINSNAGKDGPSSNNSAHVKKKNISTTVNISSANQDNTNNGNS